MGKSELSAEDVSDVVSVLSSHIKSPPQSVSGDLIRELSSETRSGTSSGLSLGSSHLHVELVLEKVKYP